MSFGKQEALATCRGSTFGARSTRHLTLQIVDNHGVPIRESGDPELQRSLELQAGPARSRLSLEGVPLERQISVKFPTIITPSAEAEQIRIDIPGVSAQEAAQSYVGELRE